MSHSITVLQINASAQADEILEELADRLEIPRIWRDGGGQAHLWLQFDPEEAFEAIVAALDEIDTDWHECLEVIGPHEEVVRGDRVSGAAR